jgi:hypothetical protein
MNLILVLDTYQPFDKYFIERQIMRKKSLLWAAFSIAALTANCQPTAQSTQSGAKADNTNVPSPSVKQQWQTVKSDITNTWQDVKQTTTQAYVAVKTSTTQAWTSVKNSMQSATDYTYDKKNEFVAGAQTDLNALDKKFKNFSDKAANTTGSTKADAQAKLQSLRDKRAVLDKKLDGVKKATAADWNDAKTAFKNSYDDTKNSLNEAWQWLKLKS